MLILVPSLNKIHEEFKEVLRISGEQCFESFSEAFVLSGIRAKAPVILGDEIWGDGLMALTTFERAVEFVEVDALFEALPLLNEVIAKEPERAEAYVWRAKVRRRLGDGEGVIADYTQAIKLAPTAENYLARALVWLSLDKPEGAVADGREAVAMKPEFAGAQRLLGKALGLMGDGEGAITAYKKAARCYLDAKDKQNAQACIDAIEPLRKLPPLPTPAKGTSSLPGSLAQATPGLNAEEMANDYVQKVRQKYEDGYYAAAMKDLNWLLNIEPIHSGALCLRGLIQAQLGRREQAIADLALAKQHHPNDLEVQLARGQMRLILKDGYGAIEEFTALIDAAIEPDKSPDPRFFAYRGNAYRQIGEQEQAFKDYSNALSLDSENAELYELRAQMQQSMESSDGAIEDFQRAATLWLDRGNWQKHQQVVEQVRALRNQRSAEPNQSKAAVPIKSFENHRPVVEVLLDGIAKFDLVIDRNATHSIITQKIANQLNLELVSYRYVYLLDGTPMELPVGRLRSVVVGQAIVTDVYVAIAADKATPVLGKDCFSAYSIRISGNEMTFVRRS
ncbi:MAG: tetratricopeptide repeat protein [Cyanobacteria bacterium P01_D01_bin.105]